MTITTSAGSYHLTEAQLSALALRFVVLSRFGVRRFYVDSVEVTEAEFRRAHEAAIQELDRGPSSND